MVGLRGEEQRVAACIQAALPGVTVGQHDDNTTPSAHDLDLSLGGGRTFGAMEVTAAADAQLIQSWKLLEGRGDRWIVPELVGGWSIHVRPDARIKRLLQELPGLLQALEKDRITTVPGPAERNELNVKADELGVVSALQGGTAFPGSVYVTPDIPLKRRAGMVPSTGDALSEWVAEWIIEPSRSDNLDKLRRSAARERHLFVIVPAFATPALFAVTDLLARTDAPLPTASPVLPPEVTHIWIMGTLASGYGFRWSPDHGWERFEKITVVDPSTLAGCTCREPGATRSNSPGAANPRGRPRYPGQRLPRAQARRRLGSDVTPKEDAA